MLKIVTYFYIIVVCCAFGTLAVLHEELSSAAVLGVVAMAGCGHLFASRLMKSERGHPIFAEKSDEEQDLLEIRGSWITPIHAALLLVFVGTGILLPGEDYPVNAAASFVLTFLWAEVWHYFSHRAMHTKHLHFLHKYHHESRVYGAFSALSFSLGEKSVFSLGIFGGLAAASQILPVSVVGVAAYYVFYFYFNQLGHTNRETKKAGYTQTFVGKWFGSTTYHAMHHGRYVKNYGLMTRVLDIWFGTAWVDYELVHARIVAGKPMAHPGERPPITKPEEKMQHELINAKHSQFREILELRRLVAIREKRVAPDAKLEDMADEFDAEAWHCAITKDGRVVGAARFIFPDRDARRSEIAQYTALPGWLFDVKFFEASRFVVHPDHRGGAVYTQLMRETFNLATETGVDFVIADCRSFLLKVYCRLGAVDMKAAFTHPFYPAEQMHLIHFDLKRTYAYAPGNFFYWSKVMMPALLEQVKRGRLRLSLVVRLKSLVGRFVPQMRGMEGLSKVRFMLTGSAVSRPIDRLAA